jgi:diadenosine tetraphosphatase ApaH/serine/threonine PP2A family protein phosphatase
MRIAVFSDIHGNYEALEAFIEHSSRQNIGMYVCLGDIVGYGANPNECIRGLLNLPNIRFVLGNHDAAASGRDSPYDMSRDASRAILWTIETLSPDYAEFLQHIDVTLKTDNILFSHANPYRPLAWYYVDEIEYAARSFARTKEKMLFVGHTHVSSIITRKNMFNIYFEMPEGNEVVPLNKSKRQIINCGSIGQPRDGDPRASYLIYDQENQIIEFYRIPYDYRRAAEKIRANGLPESLALRLSKGL